MRSMKRWRILLSVMSMVLTGCYSTYSQVALAPVRVHEGIEADYGGVRGASKRKDESALPAVVYRVGDEWYIAAYPAEFRVRPRLGFLSMGDAHHELIKRGPVCYYRITPLMAKRLCESPARPPLSGDELKRSMRQAGGSCLSALPDGAVAVKAPLLKSNAYWNSWRIIGRAKSRPKWYRYPLAGVTLLCVDTPINVVTFTGLLIASPFIFVSMPNNH